MLPQTMLDAARIIAAGPYHCGCGRPLARLAYSPRNGGCLMTICMDGRGCCSRDEGLGPEPAFRSAVARCEAYDRVGQTGGVLARSASRELVDAVAWVLEHEARPVKVQPVGTGCMTHT